MDSQNQFFIFLQCVAIGVIGGVLYELFTALGLLCRANKYRLVRATFDILFWLSFTIMSIISSYAFHFPSFRAYMWIGYCAGGILYLKSVRRIVAFFEKVCYNMAIKIRKRHEKQGRKP